MTDKNKFLYSHHRYNGKVRPENLVFNANLQEFSQRVGYTCALETNGKISPHQAYKNIKSLWKQLKQTKKQLGIGEHSVDESNDE
ncbi:hypothetical protein [Myxosarcina sp. GI1]|uniref:DUF7219 family protein n=1 Tax=Myxosarcina sp. GI1 TaxID=1541065 RepID=UPI00056BEE06|nr:hypothetical protein [Myxosarcina sp. GI1]